LHPLLPFISDLYSFCSEFYLKRILNSEFYFKNKIQEKIKKK